MSTLRFILFLCFFSKTLLGLSVGSKTLVSKQYLTSFPASDSNNLISGFVRLEDGFTLENNTTTCTFDCYMPVSGDVNFSGGQLHLKQDLIFSNTLDVQTGGRIYGNGKTMELSPYVVGQNFPTGNFKQGGSVDLTLESIQSINEIDHIFSCDWSHDHQYLAVGIDSVSGDELRIYYFDGSTLTLTNGAELTKDIYSVRWHPTKHFLAVGRQDASGDEVYIFDFNVSNGTVTQLDGVSLTNNRAYAVAWHPSGGYLVVGTETAASMAELFVYSVHPTTGVLAEVDSLNVSSNRRIRRDALSFAPGGNYLVAGTNRRGGSEEEILVCSFSGSSIELAASANPDRSVLEVDWCPTGTFIAVGLDDGSGQTIRIYEHTIGSPDTLNDVTSAYVGEGLEVEALQWDNFGNYLAVGTDAGVSSSVKFYYFDKTAKTLTLAGTIATALDIRALRWSRDGALLTYGDQGKNLVTYRATRPWAGAKQRFIFDSTALVLNSDTVLTTSFHIIGDCLINAQGHKLSFNDSSSPLVVRPHATLKLENMQLSNLKNFNIRCMDDTGTLHLKDVSCNFDSDFTFSRGALLFQDEVIFSGTSKFIYSSSCGSSIAQNSSFILSNGFSFSYAPVLPKNNLLYFEDSSSILHLDGCTLHSTRTGLSLDQGTLIIDDKVTLSSEGNSLSQSLNIKSGMNVQILNNANLELFGLISYD